MAEISWIKIRSDIFGNRKIRILQQMPEGDALIVIWFQLLCMAGTINDRGLIYITEGTPYTPDYLAAEMGRPGKTVELALGFFEKFGMIEYTDDGTMMIHNWEKYQNVDGMERIREQTRLRTREYRERKRLSAPCDVTCDVTVTQCDAAEENKKREEKKREEKIKPIELMGDFSDELCSAVLDWISYKSERRQPYKPTGLKSLIGQIRNKAAEYGDAPVINLINQCMASNWQGIIWDKLASPNAPVSSNRNTFLEMIQEGYFDDE